MSNIRCVSPLVAMIVLLATASAAEAEERPWRAAEAAGAPSWIGVSLTHRARFAHLADDFRLAEHVDKTGLFQRTLAKIEVTTEPIGAVVEIEDSRSYGSDETAIDTTMSNPVEVLAAFVSLNSEDVLGSGDTLSARLGRFTMDIGSRRFVARNRYRNTINGFTGLDAQWSNAAKTTVRAFAVMPVQRLPNDAAELEANEIEFDEENTDTLFAGAFYGTPNVAADIDIELFAFGLFEGDSKFATKNRRIVTPGFRLMKETAGEGLGFQVEGVIQLGKSRASKADDDTEDLDHLAYFAHAEVSTKLNAAWEPQLVLQYDLASGDRDPADGDHGRFETLFGARRFDFGPTGIYGPFARANLSSPGLRLKVDPVPKNVDGFVAYRLFWLASDTDSWSTTGLRDPAGDSGSFLGQQIEFRLRYHLLPKNLDLELGAAYLIRGGFARDVGGNNSPATFVYTSVTGTI